MLNNSKKMLSWLIDHLEIETSLQHLSRYHQQWSTSIQGQGQASFHLILQQDCHFHLLEEQNFIHLYQGDAIFLFKDTPFIITDTTQRIAPSLTQLQRNLVNSEDSNILSCSTHLACGYFTFRSKFSELFIAALPPYLVLRQDDQALTECSNIFELIRHEAGLDNAASISLIERLTSILFYYLIRHTFSQENHKKFPLWILFNDPTLYALILEIVAKPDADWTLQSMAAVCGISRANFSKYFSDIAGFSATQFVLYYRVQLAQQYLAQGMSIADCSEKIGYQSVAAFTRAFQRVTQKNPSQFMKR
ncbi:AraC family transcriptional regulator [Acinetobacter sp. Marseille-Q1618]|uniref:AraC family transcriptional regulator n=1 Tax=Acinetobacter sp. Marseille-Q1618 TaxID=2697502 RepID=UPI00156F8B87|nr:AraC family transcriptional regulator [Acinetobacter sp. Marseille-Q1618]